MFVGFPLHHLFTNDVPIFGKIRQQNIFKINELRALRQNWSAAEKAEVDDILAKLNDAKRQIIELEKRKLDLSHEERHLADKLEEDDLKYKCMVNIPVNVILFDTL